MTFNDILKKENSIKRLDMIGFDSDGLAVLVWRYAITPMKRYQFLRHNISDIHYISRCHIDLIFFQFINVN
jgi:hypothetical protein